MRSNIIRASIVVLSMQLFGTVFASNPLAMEAADSGSRLVEKLMQTLITATNGYLAGKLTLKAYNASLDGVIKLAGLNISTCIEAGHIPLNTKVGSPLLLWQDLLARFPENSSRLEQFSYIFQEAEKSTQAIIKEAQEAKKREDDRQDAIRKARLAQREKEESERAQRRADKEAEWSRENKRVNERWIRETGRANSNDKGDGFFANLGMLRTLVVVAAISGVLLYVGKKYANRRVPSSGENEGE